MVKANAKHTIYLAILLTLLLCLFSSFAFAYSPVTDFEQTAFEQPKHNPMGTGAMISFTPLPVNFDVENITESDSIAFGSTFNPTICDMDGDGNNEIVVVQSTNLSLYNGSTGSLTLMDSYIIGSGTGFQPVCADIDENNPGKELFIVSGLVAVSIGYDSSSGLNLLTQSLISNTAVTESTCIANVSGRGSACYFVDDNDELVEILPYLDNSNVTYPDHTSCTTYHLIGQNGYGKTRPFIADIDGDGNLEVAMHCADNSASDLHVYAYEFNDSLNSINPYFDDDLYGGDGLVEISTDGGAVANFMGFNVDSLGDIETCLTYTSVSAGTGVLLCLNSDGSTYNQPFDGGGFTVNDYAQMVYTDYNADGDNEFVIASIDGASANLNLRVVDPTTSSTLTAEFINATLPTVTKSDYFNIHASGVDVNNDNSVDLILAGRVLLANGTDAVFEDDVFLNNSFCSFGLVNSDNYVDIVCAKASNTYLYLGIVSAPPTASTITLNPSLDNSGFYNYYPTVCKGTTQTFKADECITGSSFSDSACSSKTYVNTDTLDQERLVVSGCTGGTQNGALSNYLPTVDCDFNSTGTTSVTIYVQEDDDLTDFSVSDTITINVVDGTPGTDCNVPTSFINTPGEQTTSVPVFSEDTAVQNMFNDISGNSTQLKAIIGVIIMIMAGIWLFGQTKSGMFAGIGALLSGVVCVVFGLFTVTQVITVIGTGLVLSFLIVVFNIAMRNAGG